MYGCAFRCLRGLFQELCVHPDPRVFLETDRGLVLVGETWGFDPRLSAGSAQHLLHLDATAHARHLPLLRKLNGVAWRRPQDFRAPPTMAQFLLGDHHLARNRLLQVTETPPPKPPPHPPWRPSPEFWDVLAEAAVLLLATQGVSPEQALASAAQGANGGVGAGAGGALGGGSNPNDAQSVTAFVNSGGSSSAARAFFPAAFEGLRGSVGSSWKGGLTHAARAASAVTDAASRATNAAVGSVGSVQSGAARAGERMGGMAVGAVAKARAKAAEASAPLMRRQATPFWGESTTNSGGTFPPRSQSDRAIMDDLDASTGGGSSSSGRARAGSSSPPPNVMQHDGLTRRRAYSSSSPPPMIRGAGAADQPQQPERTLYPATSHTSLISSLFTPVSRRRSESFPYNGSEASLSSMAPQEQQQQQQQREPATTSTSGGDDTDKEVAANFMRLHSLALAKLRAGDITIDEFEAILGSHAALLGVNSDDPSTTPAPAVAIADAALDVEAPSAVGRPRSSRGEGREDAEGSGSHTENTAAAEGNAHNAPSAPEATRGNGD